MNLNRIHLRILLPYGVFLELDGIKRIVAETDEGLFGVLPQRLDCSAAILPGILTYETDDNQESYVAHDQGVLLKTGNRVTVSVRNATRGSELGELRKAVDDLYSHLNEGEQAVKTVLAKLESSFIRQLMQFGHEKP